MFLGYQWWLEASILFSLAAVVAVLLRTRLKPWSYRITLCLGVTAVIWSVLPGIGSLLAGEIKVSPIMFLSAVVSFGLVAIADSLGSARTRKKGPH